MGWTVTILAALGALAYFVFPKLPSEPKPLYRYEDDRGTHFVDSLDKVPPELRQKAERVDGTLPGIGRGDYEKYHDAVGSTSSRKRRH